MVIETNRVIETAAGKGNPLLNAGAPVGGTNEVQTATFGGTWLDGDTFKLKFDGQTTAAIAWSATNATLVANVDAALEALPNIGTGGVAVAVGTMTSGIGTLTITAGGDIGKKAISTLTVTANTSAEGTLAITETTPGVNATGRGAGKGAKLIDTTNGVDYINTGTATSPTWTKTGTQS